MWASTVALAASRPLESSGRLCFVGQEQELLHDRMLTEKSPFERMMEVGEQYLPRRVLWGLLPEALLEDYNFYQENAPPHRVIRGYPAKGRWPSEHEEEELLDSDASNKKAGASF